MYTLVNLFSSRVVSVRNRRITTVRITVAANIEPCLSAPGYLVAFGDVGNLVGFWETPEVRADIPEKLEPLTSRVFTHRAVIDTLRTARVGNARCECQGAVAKGSSDMDNVLLGYKEMT